MEDILKLILNEIKEIKQEQIEMRQEQAHMQQDLAQVIRQQDNLNDKLDMHIQSNKEEFRQLNSKIDSITNALATVMEDITELKDKIDKQDVEIRVIKGGK